MNIIVCIKQVPNITANVSWTKDLTMKRKKKGNIMNPLDEYALEVILRIKNKYPDTFITAISMGPLHAKEVLKKALVMGVDKAILLNDPKFAGSDTLATSYTLSQVIKEKFNDFDLIFFGQSTLDSGTGQVGPSVSEFLDLPQVTFVNKILSISKEKILVSRDIENKTQEIEMSTPGVVCLIKPDSEPDIPIFKKIKNALLLFFYREKNKIQTITFNDLKIDPNKIGINGSPTSLSKLSPVAFVKKCEFIDVKKLAEIIKK